MSENAFGLLVKKFQLFDRAIQQQPINANKAIMAAVVLHNFLRENPKFSSSSAEDGNGLFPEEDVFPEELPDQERNPKTVRLNLQEYFCNEGERDFQYERVLDH